MKKTSEQSLRGVIAPFFRVLYNLCLVLLAYFICRGIFLLVNHELLRNITLGRFFFLEFHSLKFDISGIVFSNLPYILLALIPFAFRNNNRYQLVLKWMFVIINSIWVAVNLADSVFFQYTEKRTTFSFFSEFQAEDNLLKITLIELVSHWYLVVLFILFVLFFVYLYRKPYIEDSENKYGFKEYILHTLSFLIACFLSLGGLRGSYNYEERPLMLSYATEFVENPIECGVILNTTFCMFRTIGKDAFVVPEYFVTDEERSHMKELYNPIHHNPAASFQSKNVIVFILESFSTCYSDYLSTKFGAHHDGNMPFLDSLMRESLSFQKSFANGNVSIDALPSVICGLPPMIESICSTPYISNNIPSLASYLDQKGYYTAFFHGAHSGSMGLTSFAKTIGYRQEYSLDTYPDKNDYDCI